MPLLVVDHPRLRDAAKHRVVVVWTSRRVRLLDVILGEPWSMWTAEQTRQYVAKVACVPADDLQRLFLPGKSESTYCFLQDDADTTHAAHFRDGRAEPLVVMLSAS